MHVLQFQFSPETGCDFLKILAEHRILLYPLVPRSPCGGERGLAAPAVRSAASDAAPSLGAWCQEQDTRAFASCTLSALPPASPPRCAAVTKQMSRVVGACSLMQQRQRPLPGTMLSGPLSGEGTRMRRLGPVLRLCFRKCSAVYWAVQYLIPLCSNAIHIYGRTVAAGQAFCSWWNDSCDSNAAALAASHVLLILWIVCAAPQPKIACCPTFA